MDSDSQRENANGAAPSSATLESLLSDPALMDRLQETIRSIRSAGEMPAKEQPKTTEPPVREESRATPLREEENIHAGSIPDGLSAVLSKNVILPSYEPKPESPVVPRKNGGKP